ncbi:hypothetical protein JJQ72_04740 [Paenibacillus sp. F411]|uniref:hypothetical protein n=1 Tax=Paenibacillus sp. F411 TaxID=2820239 RepID=UPI001AAF4E0D|nr:hypothetical protein [Paenibacillus sp. F411]MBO2943288.1 hypothetical protein [Paenibacillus sp. F411]
MSKSGKKLAAFLLWAGVGILIGLQLGGEGRAVQDTAAGLPAQMQGYPAVEQPAPSLQGNIAGPEQEAGYGKAPEPARPKFEPVPRDILLPGASSPPADVLADKTGGLLQRLSNQSIRWVVSLFGSITD